MAEPTKRKHEPPQIVTFDEQLWPVNVALLVMGGFVAGCIIALSEFDNPTWYNNGWVRLSTLVATLVFALVVASRLNNKLIRRGIQLAAILSLLVHMVLMVGLVNVGKEYLAEIIREADEVPTELEQQEERVTIPDYYFEEVGESEKKVQQEFERPVQTRLPEQNAPTPVEREVTTAEDHPVENKTPIEPPDGAPEVQPLPAQQRRVEQAAPKRANTQGKLSRNLAKPSPRPQPTEIADTPDEPSTPSEDEPNILQLNTRSTASRQRSSSAPAANSRVNSPSETMRIPERTTARATRRELPDPSPLPASSTPMLTRRLNQPSAVPTAGAADVQDLAESNSTSTTTGSSTTSVSRQSSRPTASVAMMPSSEPRAARAPTVGPFSASRVDNAPASDQPQVGARPSAAPARSLASANFGAMQATEGPGSGGSPGSSQVPGMGGSQSPGFGGGSPGSGGGTVGSGTGGVRVARSQSSSGMSGGAPASLPGGGLGTSGLPGGGLPGAPLQRAEAAGVPSLNPTATAAGRPSRAVTAARVEGSPSAIDSPGTSPSQGDTASSIATRAGPTSGSAGGLTLSRGSSGVSGGGQSMNFGTGATDMSPSPGQFASVSATRAQATQTGGPSTRGSTGPSSNSPLARGIATANVASATLQASSDVAAPDSVGAGTVGEVSASSGAGIARSSGGSAARGPVNASAGSGDLDIGPTSIVGRTGPSRVSAGGGGPTLRSGTVGPGRGLGVRGGGALATLNAPGTADVPEAPPGDGGGAPTATGNNTPGSAAVARTPGGGANAPAGGPGAGGGGLSVGGSGPGGGSGGTGVGGLGGPGVGGMAGGGGSTTAAGGLATRAGGSGPGGDGPSLAGGGSRGPSRSVGRAGANMAPIADDVAQLPTGPDTAGEPTGEVAAAATPGGVKAVRGAAGLPGPVVTANVGAAAGPMAVNAPTVGAPGVGLSERKSEEAGEPSATVGSIAASGRLRRTTVAGLPGGTPDMIADPVLDGTPGDGTAGGTADGSPDGSPFGKGGGGGLARRSGGGGTPVQVASAAGPGGLGAELAPEVGSLSRRASSDGQVVHAGTARVANRKIAGGPIAVDGTIKDLVVGVPRYGGKQKRKSGGPGLPLEPTEIAVQSGLDFLARHQAEDGTWTFNNYAAGRPGYENEKSQYNSETAATGLAILAFYGAGFDHREGQYRATVRGGIDSLVRNQRADGDLYVPIDAETTKVAAQYSHAIAAMALCQAYAVTGDEVLRGPAQKALDLIVAAQESGSSRLSTQFGTDASLCGWQFLALQSGEMAGLSVPPAVFTSLKRQVDSTMAPTNNRRAALTSQAVSLLMRLHVGEDRSSPEMVKAADALLAGAPTIGTASQPGRDASYWYFGTQAMFMMGGQHWDGWRENLHPLLVDRQMQNGPFAGSWDPAGSVPDRWGTQAGRIFVSGVDVLTLEVHHHNLPLYEKK